MQFLLVAGLKPLTSLRPEVLCKKHNYIKICEIICFTDQSSKQRSAVENNRENYCWKKNWPWKLVFFRTLLQRENPFEGFLPRVFS